MRVFAEKIGFFRDQQFDHLLALSTLVRLCKHVQVLAKAGQLKMAQAPGQARSNDCLACRKQDHAAGALDQRLKLKELAFVKGRETFAGWHLSFCWQ